MGTAYTEAELLGDEIMYLLITAPEPHDMKNAKEQLDYAVARYDVPLLKSYLRSIKSGLGMVAGHFIHLELETRGYTNISEYVEPWRHKVRIDLLHAMKLMQDTMDDYGLVPESIDCIVAAYTADSEAEGRGIASLIKRRHITEVSEVRRLAALIIEHHGSVSEGVL